MILIAVQSKMARAAVGWGVRDLAKEAGVSTDTIARFERGEILKPATIIAIRKAFEAAGIEFTDGQERGVKLNSKYRDPSKTVM